MSSIVLYWIKQSFWGGFVLCIDFSKFVNKEAIVPDTPELISESYDLSIKIKAARLVIATLKGEILQGG